MGKTILLKHIAYSWAEQGMLQKYNLVLLVQLRDPTVQKMSSPKSSSNTSVNTALMRT